MRQDVLMSRRKFCAVGTALALGGTALRAGGRKPDMVKLGLVKSLFREVPEPLVMFAMEPSRQYFEQQMGVKSVLRNGGSPLEMGKALKDDTLQLGVFHGVEFAWAKQRYPGLEPLFIAVNVEPILRSCLIVRKSARIRNLAALRNKMVLLPTRGREHSYLFLERKCVPPGKKPFKHFDLKSNAGGASSVLDGVAKGEATAAVVDGIDWDDYRKNPGRAARVAKLDVLLTSVPFPCAAVAHYGGNLDQGMLDKFRDGMLNAHKTAKGRKMLGIMRITHFEKVPDGYGKQLEAVAKAYPLKA